MTKIRIRTFQGPWTVEGDVVGRWAAHDALYSDGTQGPDWTVSHLSSGARLPASFIDGKTARAVAEAVDALFPPGVVTVAGVLLERARIGSIVKAARGTHDSIPGAPPGDLTRADFGVIPDA